MLCALIFSSCSRSNFPADDIKSSGQSVSVTAANNKTAIPPGVIDVSDEVAKSTKDGELYYDDASGYRYWRNSDGKYYLDKKYENGASPNKNIVGKKLKKSRRKAVPDGKEDVYAIQ